MIIDYYDILRIGPSDPVQHHEHFLEWLVHRYCKPRMILDKQAYKMGER